MRQLIIELCVWCDVLDKSVTLAFCDKECQKLKRQNGKVYCAFEGEVDDG